MKRIKKNVLRPLLFIGLGLVITTIAIARDPFGTPGQPGQPEWTDMTTSSCDIEYTAPWNDGGSPIIAYLIEKKDKWGVYWENAAASTGLTCTIPDLKEGNSYQFRAIAVNKAGKGEPSDPSKPIVIQ